MSNMKSIVAGVAFALLVQYPIALAFMIIPMIYGSSSLSDGLNFIAFYFFWITVIALPIILALGLPTFYWMRSRNLVSHRNMLIAGGMMALILAAGLSWPGFFGEGFSSGENYYGTYRDMIVDGNPTIWGWISFAEDLAMFAIHGALGAAFFQMGWMKFSQQIPEVELE